MQNHYNLILCSLSDKQPSLSLVPKVTSVDNLQSSTEHQTIENSTKLMQKGTQSTPIQTQLESFEVEQSSNEHQEKSAKLPPSQVGPTPSPDDSHTQQKIEKDNDVDNNGMYF